MAPIVTSLASIVKQFGIGGLVAGFSATGGTVTTAAGYKIHSFTSPGTFTITSLGNSSSVEVLVVGSGGGGGHTIGGGGGAGGVVYHSAYSVTTTSYPVSVGSGGPGAVGSGSYPTGRGTPGGNSVFGNLTAVGGGGGGNYDNASNDAGPGGSGGGAGAAAGSGAPGSQPSQPQPGSPPGYAQYGFSGGNGGDSNNGGGGGGAGGVGGNTSSHTGGAGITYPQFSSFGVPGTFAGGGGGGGRNPGGSPGPATAGGGAGGNGTTGTNATANTGGGGGGGGYQDSGGISYSGGNGADGIVVVRYQGIAPQSSSAGHSIPMSGGISWFSSTPNYFGVDLDSEYQLQNNATYYTVTYRRTSTSAYSWWILFSSKSGNDYTPVFGARIPVSAGGSVGDTLTTNLIEAAEVFGNNTIPSSGTYYISWLSGSPGYTASSGNIFGDAVSGGSINYVQTNIFPSTSVTYTTTSGNTGSKIHIALS